MNVEWWQREGEGRCLGCSGACGQRTGRERRWSRRRVRAEEVVVLPAVDARGEMILSTLDQSELIPAEFGRARSRFAGQEGPRATTSGNIGKNDKPGPSSPDTTAPSVGSATHGSQSVLRSGSNSPHWLEPPSTAPSTSPTSSQHIPNVCGSYGGR